MANSTGVPIAEVVVLTGASRGLGAAMAEQLLLPDRKVIGVARSPNHALAALAREKGAWLDWHLQDLSDVVATDALAASICAGLPRDAKRYVLINNAGAADPIGPVAKLDVPRATAALHVNLAAAMVFTARFLAATAGTKADRRVLNISSGLGRRPMDGSSVYCASKAGLDMFTRCLKLEQALEANGARVVSLAPGVIETDMQVYMRSRDPGDFPQRAYFQGMKDEARLSTPEDAARRILAYLDRDDFGEREIDDIRGQ